jgi:class 3 adenylate cyclase
MHDAVAAMRKRGEADIFLRVGINTGSVIGGVVGLS